MFHRADQRIHCMFENPVACFKAKSHWKEILIELFNDTSQLLYSTYTPSIHQTRHHFFLPIPHLNVLSTPFNVRVASFRLIGCLFFIIRRLQFNFHLCLQTVLGKLYFSYADEILSSVNKHLAALSFGEGVFRTSLHIDSTHSQIRLFCFVSHVLKQKQLPQQIWHKAVTVAEHLHMEVCIWNCVVSMIQIDTIAFLGFWTKRPARWAWLECWSFPTFLYSQRCFLNLCFMRKCCVTTVNVWNFELWQKAAILTWS